MEVAGECVDGIREREREIPNLFPAKLPFFSSSALCVCVLCWVERKGRNTSALPLGFFFWVEQKKKKTFERLFSIFLSFFFAQMCIGRPCVPTGYRQFPLGYCTSPGSICCKPSLFTHVKSSHVYTVQTHTRRVTFDGSALCDESAELYLSTLGWAQICNYFLYQSLRLLMLPWFSVGGDGFRSEYYLLCELAWLAGLCVNLHGAVKQVERAQGACW